MKLLARTLIVLIVVYSIGFPMGIFYCKARSLFFPIQYRSMIQETALQYQLDPLLIAALIYTESNFRVEAKSKSGALGLMQIMPETALQLAHKKNLSDFKTEDLFVPKTNVELGCLYLHELGREFEDIQKILVAYNAGRSNLIRWMKNGDLLKQAYPETRQYVVKINRIYMLLKFLNGIQKLV